jgi:hypothetical protein
LIYFRNANATLEAPSGTEGNEVIEEITGRPLILIASYPLLFLLPYPYWTSSYSLFILIPSPRYSVISMILLIILILFLLLLSSSYYSVIFIILLTLLILILLISVSLRKFKKIGDEKVLFLQNAITVR